jgi:hypothetical protein
VVDDYLARALLVLGHGAEADRHRAAAGVAYRRLDAPWWQNRLSPPPRSPQRPAEVVHLHPGGDGLWVVGPHGVTRTLPAMRGLQYLRLLLDRPGVDVEALDLSDAVAGHAGVRVADADAGPLLDRQALAEATGLGGRTRATANTRERARVAVRKAITAAVSRIGETDPALGRLLRDTVVTGRSCRYEPDPGRPVRWLLDGGGR